MRKFLFVLLAALASCNQPARLEPVFASPSPAPALGVSPPPRATPVPQPIVIEVLPSATPTEATILPPPTPPPAVQPLFAGPPPRALTPLGVDLILEFEVGGRSGYDPRPEAPDARLSGITWGIGYDAHQNKPKIIFEDWQALGDPKAKRLADTHPYVGRDAQAHVHEVRDILIAWPLAADVFGRIDVAREFARARQAYGPGFEALRPNCQAALISCGFNRGYSFAGANRSEMREIKRLVPLKDYEGMAAQMRASERVWRGTEIYRGMLRRRTAEAKLIVTP